MPRHREDIGRTGEMHFVIWTSLSFVAGASSFPNFIPLPFIASYIQTQRSFSLKPAHFNCAVSVYKSYSVLLWVMKWKSGARCAAIESRDGIILQFIATRMLGIKFLLLLISWKSSAQLLRQMQETNGRDSVLLKVNFQQDRFDSWRRRNSSKVSDSWA